MTQIAIFASGTGSNAQKIMEQVPGVALVVTNNPKAGVLAIAASKGVPTLVLDKEKFFRGDGYVPEMKARGIGLIVLAGFLWKVPVSLINAYPRQIVNIHPALLPKYGGRGMYGHFVHEAVIAAGEKETGISIHFVDEKYDHGQVILQATCAVEPDDTPETIAKKVQVLEHRHFPGAIKLLSATQTV